MESPERNQGVTSDGNTQTEDPLAVGAMYSADATLLTALSDNAKAKLLTDILRNLKVSLATKLAGEDLDNDVMTCADGATYYVITTANTYIVKSGPGILYDIIITKAVDGSGVTVYDNTSAASPYIFGAAAPAISTQIADLGVVPVSLLNKSIKFNTGLTIVTTSTANMTILYR